MTLVLNDRVLETCTSPGTGSATLLGATTGFRTFSAGVGNGNTCYYTIADQNGGNWEVGLGTYTSSSNSLARTTVLSSSNAGSLVNFSSGTQNVFVTYPAEKAVYLDASGNLTLSGSITLSGGTANGVLYLDGSKAVTSGSGLVFDGTNLGLGVTPSGWQSSKRVFQFGALGAVSSDSATVSFSNNAYVNSSGVSTYLTSAAANYYYQSGGQHVWLNAPSGTAGSAISFTQAMTLDASGRLVIGGTSAASGYNLTVRGSGLYVNEDGADTHALSLRSFWAGVAPAVQVVSNDPLLFVLNGSEKMRLTSAGYLGIGTSSPQAPLQVQTVSGSGYGIKISSSDQSSGSVILGDGGSTSFNVGIARWNGSGGTYGAGGLGYFAQGSGNSGGHYWYLGDAAATSQTRVMTLDSSGNLGLGVTPSGWGAGFAPIQSSYGILSGNNQATMLANAYYNGGYKYITSNYAAQYLLSGTGQHQWFIAGSGTAGNAISFTQAMTLDASGNLMIGGTTSGGILTIGSASTASGINLSVKNSAGNNSFGTQYGAYGALASGDAYVYAATSGTGITLIADNATGVIKFATGGNSERARIDSSGNLLVGTTSTLLAGPTCQVVTGTTTPFAGRHSGTTAGKYWYFGPNSGNNYVVQNQSNTGVYVTDGGTSWTASSDERLKTDLVPITNALDKVSKLRTVTGRFKIDAEGTSRSFFIAQDFQDNFEEVLDQSNPESLGVQYSDTAPLLAAAIKELKAELDQLKATLH